MHLLRRLAATVVLPLLTLTATCSAGAGAGLLAPGDHYNLAISPDWSAKEIATIEAGAFAWSAATGVTFDTHITSSCDAYDGGYVICVEKGTRDGVDAFCEAKGKLGCTFRNMSQSSIIYLWDNLGRNMQEVVEHELGHALGLQHTQKNTLMYHECCELMPHAITPQDVSQYWALRGRRYPAVPPYRLTGE